MTIAADVLYKGCLTASIAHAIMTDVYPELSYEQSWDGGDHSLQDTAGMRGTLSFSDGICVGAVALSGGLSSGAGRSSAAADHRPPRTRGRRGAYLSPHGMAAVFINGLMAIVGEWLKDDCRDSIEHIGSVIRLCVRKKAAEADKQKEAQPTFGRLCLFSSDRVKTGSCRERVTTGGRPRRCRPTRHPAPWSRTSTRRSAGRRRYRPRTSCHPADTRCVS